MRGGAPQTALFTAYFIATGKEALSLFVNDVVRSSRMPGSAVSAP